MAGVGPKFLKALAGDYKQLRPEDGDNAALAVWESMVRRTTEHLATANPNFQAARFLDASGIPA